MAQKKFGSREAKAEECVNTSVATKMCSPKR